MSELRITLHDVYATGMCSKGAAKKLKGMGYDRARIRDILANGMPVDEARALGDGQFDILIANAVKRASEVNNG